MQKNKFTAMYATMLLCGSMAAQQYCIPPQGSSCESDKIMNVSFAGINNSSGCSDSGYTDYSALAPCQVSAEETYTLSVTPEFGLTNVGVWIDYNHDKIFGADEFTNLGGSSEPATLTAAITIPADAMLGVTRMRVKCQLLVEVGPGSSCSLPAWDNGETEDYAVMINAATASDGDFSMENFSVYPNPANDFLTIVIPEGVMLFQLSVYDLTGHLVLHDNSGAAKLDVKSLASGMYIIKIQTEGGSMAARFLKN